MKAAVFYGKHDIRIEEREIPVAGPGQMVVKMNYCGVCGTDVEAYNNEVIKPVIVFGHENAATVYEVGEGVTEFKVGDKVLCGPPSACREKCAPCREGRTNICEYGFPRTNGIGGPDGGYAEYMLIGDVAHTNIIPIPEGVDMKDAVLFDIICVSLHAFRKSNYKYGDTVAISGTGPIGLAAIRIAKSAGARKIIAVGTSDEKESICRQYGADYYINAKKCPDLRGEILKITGDKHGADVTFECAGNQNSLLNCLHSLSKAGSQVVLVGTIGDMADQLCFAAVSPREIDLISSFTYTREDIDIYLEQISKGNISFPGMVTDIIRLDEVVDKALDRKDGKKQIKVLIEY